MVFPDVIDIAQSAFIKERSISDNILMVQELFRGYGRESGGANKCALKINLRKSFDSISRDFILQALTQINFPARFIQWIKEYITTRFSVKVNGGLNDYLKGAKGLRQGDPMSPYLFAIGLNVLSCLLAQTLSDFKYHWKWA
ncbi:secreted RxLR effector protein 78-like [Apium graveolens]|uniref:secreted RxLR effector protein 78-like n=1 Tax=Apium graveolens TaxID=4045 RepID=UPI003D7A404C